MRGFWADERVEGNIWNLGNPLFKLVYKFFKKREIKFLNLADHTISLTQKAKDDILDRPTISSNPIKIKVIPCCVDMDHFNPEKVKHNTLKRLRSELNISENDLVMSYVGSIGTWYLLEDMLRFFKSFLKRYPNGKFLFISKEHPETIIKEAEKLDIPISKIIIRGADRQEMPALLKLSQFSLLFIIPTFSKKASSPTKMGELMSMGIPYIANSNVGDIEHIAKQGGGIIVEAFDEISYSKTLDKIDALLKVPPQQIRAASQALFSLEKGIEFYTRVYREL